MRVRHFYTNGKQDINECWVEKPEPTDDQVEVKARMTGICRSDIAMYDGKFGPLPIEMQGHEGLGEITKVGKNLASLYKVGDLVATRADMAFADFYNCTAPETTKVPVVDPKYILEPVACGINIAETLIKTASALGKIEVSRDEPIDILILGTGFLAQIVYFTLQYTNANIHVVGRANVGFWSTKFHCTLYSDVKLLKDKKFKYVIDLSDKPEYLELDNIDNDAIVVVAAEKSPAVTTQFAQALWKAQTWVFPSPRNPRFHESMHSARIYLDRGLIGLDNLWTKGYTRADAKTAFEEGLNRPQGYSRGYIIWDEWLTEKDKREEYDEFN